MGGQRHAEHDASPSPWRWAARLSPALAQDGDAADWPSRYTFNRVDDGFLRLDNQSGQVAFCSPHSVGWACQAVPEDRAALEKEIARLQDEVASLKTRSRGLARAATAAAAGGSVAAADRQERRRGKIARGPRARPRRGRKRLAASGRHDREFPEGHDAQGLMCARRYLHAAADYPPITEVTSRN